MAWVRLDDQMINHPKIEQVGVVGLGLHVAALCYSNHNLTDGFISTRRLELLVDMGDVDRRVDDATELSHPAHRWARILVDAGIWEEVDGGYQIHDYHDYQPTRREVLREREERSQLRSDAGARGGKQKASKAASKRVANDQQTGKQTCSKRVANVQQTCSKAASKCVANGVAKVYPRTRIPYPYPVPDPGPLELPPNPPLAEQEGGISRAALRALEGSNRKRDVAAAKSEVTLEQRYLGKRA